MSERSFLGDILGRVARASRGRRKGRHPSPIELCADILGEKSEVSGMVAALDLLDGFERLENWLGMELSTAHVGLFVTALALMLMVLGSLLFPDKGLPAEEREVAS